MSTESAPGEEEAGTQQPGSQELSELTVSWPSPAVGVSPGRAQLPERLGMWADRALHGEGVHGASGAGALLDLHSGSPPQGPWCGLCAPCYGQCLSAHLVRAPGWSGRKLGCLVVPPQWPESGCVTWVLFSIRWGTRSRFRVQSFCYSDDMFLLTNPWIQKPNCRQVT